jgi:hypothetical protein
MAYSITINSSAAARALAAEKGYNFVFAKRVDTDGTTGDVGGAEYNIAWFVLNPKEIGDSITVSWDASTYSATFNDFRDTVQDAVELQPGGYYSVADSFTLEPYAVDPDPNNPAFHFLNGSYPGYVFTPILLAQDPAGNKAQIWVHKGMAREDNNSDGLPQSENA